MGLNVDRTFLECSCGCARHTLRFSRYRGFDDFDKFLVVDMHLGHYMSRFKRLWYGLQYIFGFKSSYGAFDEVLLERRDVEKLRDLCNEHLKRMDEKEWAEGELEDIPGCGCGKGPCKAELT